MLEPVECLLGSLDLHHGAGGQAVADDLLKVEDGRSHDDGRACKRGLDHVLGAVVLKGSAHGRHVGQSAVEAHFAHAVAEHDVGVGGHVGGLRNLRAAADLEACAGERAEDLVEALRMTRHQPELRTPEKFGTGGHGLRKQHLLALTGRGDERDGAAERRLPGTRGGLLGGVRTDIELDAAADGDVASAKALKTLLVLLALREDGREAAEGGAHHVEELLGLSAGLLAFARIGKHHRHAAPLGLAHEVRPHLGLHDDADRGLGLAEELLDGIRRVVGQIALMDAVGRKRHKLGAGLATRRRHVREQHVALRPALENRLEQRLSGIRLAHAHGVDPDARTPRLERKARPGEALVPELAVSGLAAGAPHQIKTGERERNDAHRPVHGRSDSHKRSP